jgi:hypothetical protein
MRQQTPSRAPTSRQVVVATILTLQQQLAGRSINVNTLIDQNRRERERAETGD